MAKTSALDTLIELATNETDAAARKLGNAIRACDDTEKKLDMLLQYRDDYAARFQSKLASGLTAAGYRNFQLFMDKLDAAIDGQQQIVEEAKKRVGHQKNAWQASERKRVSYDTLATRAHQAEERKENKRDQKQTDEFAARQAQHKQ